MARVVGIGNQSFESIRKKDTFYIDKTAFIKEWWENEDIVTLITRPRRFGKTLNMDMLRCFFSNEYKDRGELFEGLNIWEDEKYRKIQGAYPVIFLSFAGIKGNTFELSRKQISDRIIDLYESNRFLLKSDCISDTEKARYISFLENPMDEDISFKLNELSNYLSRYYKKKVIILLDEYDTPMQEAYVNGYWEELVAFTRSLFNSTFKTNPYLERAIMTGITRVSKESTFSDLNNLKVITVTSDEYSKCFGFTEEEVFDALDEQELSSEKEKVKKWYDGVTFGTSKDVYNPWSIINFLDEKKYKTYWADSSSNGLVSQLIQQGSSKTKVIMEELLEGKSIKTKLDEQIVFNQLDGSSEAIWSLLLASGYLKVDYVDFANSEGNNIYELSLTNFEVKKMFEKMIDNWFKTRDDSSSEFVSALIQGDLDAMNYYINEITANIFSCFDVAGKEESRIRPENFYHGFVLGLMVDQIDNYIITSNRESGFGRYDIMLEPINKNSAKYQGSIPTGRILPGIIIEFKVINPRKENTLEETVEAALKQIEEKNYDAELIGRGVNPSNIHHYGFAFKGKEVLIDGTRKDAS